MKTSKITASSIEPGKAAFYGNIPGKKKTEVQDPGHFAEDDDEFDIPLDDEDLASLDDLELDDDDF
jgi:hypothetical protein